MIVHAQYMQWQNRVFIIEPFYQRHAVSNS